MLDDTKPIFIQIREQLEDAIINDSIKPDERVPSTNEFAKNFKINPATAGKGINQLVEEGILVKKRGIGMFVTENAKKIIIRKRRNAFFADYVLPLKKEAEKLALSKEDIFTLLEKEEKK